jgi:hypothetical protein
VNLPQTLRGLRPSSLLRSLFFFLALLLLNAAQTANAEEPPKVTLERVVDGRGNRVCDIAKASVKSENERRSAWVVRGLFWSDLILCRWVRRDVNSGESTVDEIRLGDRAPLRFEGGTPGSRVSATSPASTFRYFDVDVARSTVRCNLERLVEETDHELLGAGAEYWAMKQGMGEKVSIEELPVLMLLAIEKRPPHPSPPIRKKEPLSEDAPEAAELKAAALAALDEK